MKIFSLANHTSVSDPDHGEFEVAEDGSLDVPDALGEILVGRHVGGEKQWETEGERSVRLVVEEEARRRDPMTLLAAVEKMAEAQAPAEEPAAPAKKSTASAKKK